MTEIPAKPLPENLLQAVNAAAALPDGGVLHKAEEQYHKGGLKGGQSLFMYQALHRLLEKVASGAELEANANSAGFLVQAPSHLRALKEVVDEEGIDIAAYEAKLAALHEVQAQAAPFLLTFTPEQRRGVSSASNKAKALVEKNSSPQHEPTNGVYQAVIHPFAAAKQIEA